MEQHLQPLQNLFMASLYFFIPVQEPVSKELFKFKQHKYDNDDFQNIQCELEYCQIGEKVTSNVHLGEEWEKKIALSIFLLHYSHSRLKISRYFIAVGTSVDKLFDEQGYSTPDNLLSAKDIINIRRSFVRNELSIADKNVNSWIRDVCGQNHLTLCPEHFCASVVDLTSVKVSNTGKMSHDELSREFEKQFESQGLVKAYNEVIDDCDRFCYGLLKCDTYYEAYTDDEIQPFIDASYYSKKFERIYANPMGVVFVKTHSPFERSTRNNTSKMSHTIIDVFNLIEYSLLVDVQQQIKELFSFPKVYDIEEIDHRFQRIDELLNNNAFQQNETDHKVKVLIASTGIGDYAQELVKELGAKRLRKEREMYQHNKRQSTINFLALFILTAGIALYGRSIFWGIICIAVSILSAAIYVIWTYNPHIYPFLPNETSKAIEIAETTGNS